MNNLENLTDLLDKEVSRREFLLHLGTALLAVVGISSLIKNLAGSIGTKKQTSIQSGYGASTYSGRPTSTLSL